MREPEDRPRHGRSEAPERAATLVLRVWGESEGDDRQLKARLVFESLSGQDDPADLDGHYAVGIDGILVRVRAWLIAFDRNSRG